MLPNMSKKIAALKRVTERNDEQLFIFVSDLLQYDA